MGTLTTLFVFFKRKYSNDLETNTSGAKLPTTNIKIPIPINADVPIEKNHDIPIEENVNVPIEENSQTKFQTVDISLLELKHDPGLHSHMFFGVS